MSATRNLPVPVIGEPGAGDELPAPAADLVQLAMRINGEHKAATTAIHDWLDHALAAGAALNAAKNGVSHGHWLPWLRANCNTISTRTAQVYMKLDRNRDALGGNTQRAAHHLSLRQALQSVPTRFEKLVALPQPAVAKVLSEEKEDDQDKALTLARKKERVHKERQANAEKGSARKDLLAMITERFEFEEQADIARLLRTLDLNGWLLVFIGELERSAEHGLQSHAVPRHSSIQ